MLSLPLLPPQTDSRSLYASAPFRPLVDSPATSNSQHNNQPHQQQQQRQQQQRLDEARKAHNARSPLALLAADEAAIAHRKAAIRNFGAYWIRPPGVSKTLQAMTEELAELAEQEEMLRQEQGLRDMQAQQELQEARERAAETAAQEGVGEEERDLDEEIPDADDAEANEGDDEEEEEDDGDDDDEDASAARDVTFNEDSMMEGSQMVDDNEGYAAMEEAELTGAARDEEELGMEPERDLDDSVPEAGSYQHTDTELEDSLSDSELRRSSTRRSTRPSRAAQSSFAHSTGSPPAPSRPVFSNALFNTPPAGAAGQLGTTSSTRSRQQGHLVGQTSVGGEALTRSPASLNLSSSLLGSSFMDSSPVLQRGSNAARRAAPPRRRGGGS